MDNVVGLVLASDATRRQQAYDYLVKFLEEAEDGESFMAMFDDCSRLFEGICLWINSSSFKISLNGLDLINKFSVKLGEKMRPYIHKFSSALFDRLGDSKEQVRIAAHEAIGQLLDNVCAAQYLFDQVPAVFQSKQPRVREESLNSLRSAMERYGGNGLLFSKMLPSITKLLDDPVPNVRDGAFQTLVLAYRIHGERLRSDIFRRNLVPSNKLPTLIQKFDEVKDSGDFFGTENEVASADVADTSGVTGSGMSQSVIIKRTGSTSCLSAGTGSSRYNMKSSSGFKKGVVSSPMTQSQQVHVGSVKGRDDGSVDEEIFRMAFTESVSYAQQNAHRYSFSTSREIAEFMSRVRDVLADSQYDWEKRRDSLRDFRSFVILDGPSSEDFWTGLRSLEIPFQSAVRDLRSQLVRDACITIAFLAHHLGESGRLDHFAESILPSLLQQIHNSARIMSSAAITCVQFLVSGVQAPRLIPILAGQLSSSRSAVIRKHCCEFIDLALQQWPTNGCLDRQMPLLIDAVKRGLSDADQEARAYSRRAFWQLKVHFPAQADALFGQLDPHRQKYINADQPLKSIRTGSAIGQHSSRPPAPHTASSLRSRSASRGTGRGLGSAVSDDDIVGSIGHNGVASANGRLGVGSHPPVSKRVAGCVSSPSMGKTLPPVPSVPSHIVSANVAVTHSPSSMSSSAISSGKVPRSLPFNSPGRNTGLSPQTPTTPTAVDSPGNRMGGRSRIPVSHSQPGSRSQSPSPRTAYITHNANPTVNNATPGHLSANINARIGSQQTGGDENYRARQAGQPGPDELTKQLSIRLGLGGLGFGSPATRGTGSCVAGGTGDDANSDAGSMCSDRSFGGMSRLSDRSAPPAVGRQLPMSVHDPGSLCRLFSVADVASGRVCYGPGNSTARKKDYGQLVNRLGSSAWEDRRAGLTELQAQLITGQLVALNQSEIDRLTSVFTKLFNDPNKKVFSLFLDVLVDFVVRFYPQLDGWLFIMLTRLLTRYGAGDLLESVQNRVLRCIDVAREYFPPEIQFSTVMNIILDNSQAQSVKAKVAILNYLQQLATYTMEPSHLVESDHTKLVLFRLITWTCDVRSADIRRAAQGAIIALFNLNSAEFSQILMKLQPKTQQMAMAILQSHMQNTSTQQPPPPPAAPSNHVRRPSVSEDSGRGGSSVSGDQNGPEDRNRFIELIRETTSDIQNLSRMTSMGDGPSANEHNRRPPIPPSPASATPLHNAALPRPYNPGVYQSSPTTSGVPTTLPSQQQHANSIMSQLGALQSPATVDPARRLANCVATLSLPGNAATTTTSSPRSGQQTTAALEERQRALKDIAGLTRQTGADSAWQAEFKNVLFLLSEMLLADLKTGDDISLRSTTLQTLEKLVVSMPQRFSEYVDFVVLRVLDERGFRPTEHCTEANANEVGNQQVRDVERCAMALASCLPAEALLRVLCPLIDRADYPQNELSVKMVTKAVERLDRAALGPLLGSVCPGLVRACEHSQSSVRKAAVFCLVSLYLVVGEQLRQHLTSLSQVKTKLLNLYIERTVTQMAQAQARRETTSRTTNGTNGGTHMPLSEANAGTN